MCTQLASMGVACSDETGQTGGVVEYVGSNLGSCGGLFYDDMLECTTMATWGSIMIRSLNSTIIKSLNSTMTLSGGYITVMIKYSIHFRVCANYKVDQKSSKNSS